MKQPPHLVISFPHNPTIPPRIIGPNSACRMCFCVPRSAVFVGTLRTTEARLIQLRRELETWF